MTDNMHNFILNTIILHNLTNQLLTSL